MTGEFLNDAFGCGRCVFSKFLASERDRTPVDLGQARGKYGQPKFYLLNNMTTTCSNLLVLLKMFEYKYNS